MMQFSGDSLSAKCWSYDRINPVTCDSSNGVDLHTNRVHCWLVIVDLSVGGESPSFASPISYVCIVKSNVEQHIDSGSVIRCWFYVRCVPIVSSAPKLWLSDSSKAPKMKTFSTFLWLCRSQPFDVGSVLVEAILSMLIGRTKSLFKKAHKTFCH